VLRDRNAGSLRPSDDGTTVTLAGWVARRRDHGGVIFIDLRDASGVAQVVFHSGDVLAAAHHLRSEYCVRVTGTVAVRPEGNENPELPTGGIEVEALTLEVLSESAPLPFQIDDSIAVGEETRLKYRYLDLRRTAQAQAIRLRAQISKAARGVLDDADFVEIETPTLTRSTPEGARDFLVPARLKPGAWYALPQSPQLFKQLLMVAGMERYYQIARCYRDEDFRADRQPEFTQLDVEMSFVEQDDVIAVAEQVLAALWRLIGHEIEQPIPRMTYTDALNRYGSDKPDLRYGMELANVGEVFAGTGFRAFASALGSEGLVKAFAAPGGVQLSRKELDELVQVAKSRGAAGVVWIAVEDDGVRSPVEKHLAPEEIEGVRRATGAGSGDLILIVADKPDRTNVALDGLRRHLADRLGLIPDGEWRFCWYSEPPLFDWSDEEGKWVSNHHPFTSPLTDDLTPETAKARAYDLTLNGFELGGGSIRIHRPDVQRRVFEVLGLTHEQTEEQFGHLLRAFRFGVPPHGGIAMGIDRLVMLMAGKDTIRDVTAFPKAQSGADPLTGAPAPATEEQLRELGIAVVVPPSKDDEEAQADG